MQPIVTPDEMAAIDAANSHRLSELIETAGWAVARAALGELGGAYGRRVVILAGPGNNGADGRVAARHLSARGVRVQILDARSLPPELPSCDLVIDAAFGNGLSRPFHAPRSGDPVLAVDMASGLSGLTGERFEAPLSACRTVTFAALKPGLVLADGPEVSGRVDVIDVGLDVGPTNCGLIDDSDVAGIVPPRPRTAHKWSAAVRVIAGSPGMSGAGWLTVAAAMRAGSGMVVASSPGTDSAWPTEAVSRPLTPKGWAGEVLADIERFGAVALGPGLGTDRETIAEVRRFLARCPIPCVVDADGLAAVDTGLLSKRPAPTVLTPHDGEFRRLTERRPAVDRFATVREAAAAVHATVLLKGPTTIVADPSGYSRAVMSGDERLATAGTGDVLTGVIAALLARGLEPLDAASVGAHLHGRASMAAPSNLVAADLLTLL